MICPEQGLRNLGERLISDRLVLVRSQFGSFSFFLQNRLEYDGLLVALSPFTAATMWKD
jgi:hypothetical protein